MSLSDNYPDIRPVWMNDYANAGVIDPRCSFARSDSTPSNVHYWSDEDHVSSENLLLQSSGFDTTWSASGIGSPTGSQSAPDGTSTAWLITADTGSVGPRVQQAVSLTAGSSYTLVAHVKAGTATHAYVCLRGDSHNDYAYAILEFASPSSVTTGGVGFTGISGSVTALGSSWYRISVTSTAASVSSPIAFVGITDGTAPSSNGVATYTAAGETLYIWGAQLNTTGATDYNPTTTQIHREYAATLKPVAYSGQPRFEYEPTGDRSAKGLLIESSISNLAPYSNNFGAWGATNVVAEAGASVGPDGQPCYVMREDSSAGVQHRLSQNVNGQAYSAAHTMSVYAKKVASSNQTRYLRLRVNGLSGEASVQFDLDNGTVVRTSGSQLDGQTIIPVGNGWYRLTMTYSNTATSRAVGMIITGSPDTTDTLPSYDGDGYTAFALFGAMVEEANFPSSYTATSGSASTRTQDSLSIDLTEAEFSGGPVSVLCEFAPVDVSVTGSKRVFEINNGSDSENLRTHMNDSRMYTVVRTGNVNTAVGYISNALTDGQHIKFAVATQTNSLIASTTGFNSLGTTGAVMPNSNTQLNIADTFDGSRTLDSHWKSIRIYGEALSLTELQSLTS